MHALDRAAIEAGIACCTPHVLRHTAAVWMAEAGVPMPEIARHLGHTDRRATGRLCGTFGPNRLIGGDWNPAAP